MRRVLRNLLVVALVSGLLPAAASAGPAPVTAASGGSDNLTHVANLPHAKAPRAAENAKGSDLEFADIDVTGLPGAAQRGVSGLRNFVVAGTINIDGVANSGMQIIDVTDPTKPELAGLYECTNSQGDIQVFDRMEYGARKVYATYTTDSTGVTSSPCYREAKTNKLGFRAEDSGTFIVDITNPYAPTTKRFVEIPAGSHNQTVHPSGNYMYNSNNELARGQGRIEYFDITNLDDPVKLGELELVTGIDAHDITFNANGSRAYVAAITHTLVLDTSDPAKPSVISRIIDPTIGIQHQSDPVTIDDPIVGERTFLAITDEFAGAAGNGWCPGGGVTIYDITGDLEKTPVRIGYWNIPDVRPAGEGVDGDSLRCTSHVLRFYPDQKLMTISWYNAGVRVVDISGLAGASVGVKPDTGNVGAGMREVAYHRFDDSESWASKIREFEPDGSAYVFSNDLSRGLDVYRYSAAAPAAAEGGQWMNAAQAAARPELNLQGAQLAPYCLLASEA